MKKLVKSLLAVLVALSLGACSSSKTTMDKIKEKGVLTIATSPDYAPLEFIINGDEIVGSDIELAKYIAADLGVELKIEAMSFETVLTAVSMGNVDIGISGFAYTEQRAESFGLTYGYNKDGEDSCHGLIIPAGTSSQYKTLADFSGKKIAAQNSSLQESLATAQIPNAQIEKVTEITQGIFMIESGKVDAMACSCELAKGYAKANDNLEFAEPLFVIDNDGDYEGNVMAVAKGDTEFLEYLNKIVTKLNNEGKFEEWNKQSKELAKANGIEFED